MRTREALEKKEAFQAAAQSASWGGETVASPAQQPGKLNKLFRKISLAIAASTGDGSGSDCDISCNTASGETPCIYSNSKNRSLPMPLSISWIFVLSKN